MGDKWKQLTYDSEAWRIPEKDREVQKFFVGCIYNGYKPEVYYSPDSVAKAILDILDIYPRAILWAHNWRYDISLINEYFLNEAFRRGLLVSVNNQSPFFIRLKKDNHVLLLNDTTNFFKGVSLEKLGEMFNSRYKKELEKREYTQDANKWNEMIRKYPKKLVKACINDAKILYDVVLGMHKYFNFILKDLNTRVRWTTISVPQIGFNVAKRAIKDKLMEKYSLNEALRVYKWMFSYKFTEERLKLNERVVEAYLGGRNEAFILNHRPIFMKVLDVNSLYPYVMQRFPYPTIPTNEKTDTFIANVSFECKPGSRVLPIVYRYKFDDTVSLTEVYKGKRLMTSVEVNMIEESKECKVVKIEDPIYFESMVLFDKMIGYLYRLKQEATEKMLKLPKESEEYKTQKIIRDLAKLLMNSSYGKFGQKRTRSKIYLVDAYLNNLDSLTRLLLKGLIDNKIPETKEEGIFHWEDKYYRVLSKKLISITEEGRPIYHVPIASFVTAYARKVLYDYIIIAGKDNVYYTDTDSIFTNEEGYSNLRNYLSDTEIGKLKLEEDKSGYIKIFGKKFYVKFDDKGYPVDYTIKGVLDMDMEKAQFDGKVLKLSNHKGDIEINVETGRVLAHLMKGKVGVNEFRYVLEEEDITPKKRLNYVQIGDLEYGYPLEG